MKALRVEIYEGKSIGNCSNNGISTRFKEILLICSDGNVDIDEKNPPENLCRIVTRHICGGTYKHIEPVAPPKGFGYMNGGCICATSDSRFRRLSDYPLYLHDRQESREQYEMLSK